jgi:PAS domain S-box-containing protein
MTSTLKSDQIHASQAPSQTHPVEDRADAQQLKPDLAAIRAELERYKGLLQTLSDAVEAKVSYLDREERYLFVNEQYERWYQMTADQIVGKTAQEFMGEEYHYVKPYIDAVFSGKEARYDCPLDFPDGQHRYLRVTNIPHFNESSEVIGMFVVCHDITQQKHLEEELEQLKSVKA